MANQPPPRPWFRLSSISRPAPPPEPAPTPTPTPAPIARPALIRPVTQPQEPIVAPPVPASGPRGGTASLPNSPVLRPAAPTASLPTSPVQTTAVVAPAPTTTVVAPAPVSTSLPSSPKPRPAAPTSSLPPSPILKPAPTSSVPTSPLRKIAPTATFSVPTSPAPKTEPVTSSVTTSPVPKAVTTTTARVPSPAAPSPRTIKPEVVTPPASPKFMSTAPPPSPLVLPPAKIRSDTEPEPKIPLEAEQKSVLFQKTVDKSKPSYNGTNQTEKDLIDSLRSSIAHLGKQEASKEAETKEKIHRKKIPSDSEGGGMKVITIAGENKGAFMEVIRSPNKKHVFEGNSYQIQDKGTTRTDGWRSYSSSSSSGSSSGEEGKPKLKDKSRNGRSLMSPPMSAFMNSNVQGVNNSIVYNSSYNHHDPGIHLSMSRKPAAGGGFHIKDHSKGYHG